MSRRRVRSTMSDTYIVCMEMCGSKGSVDDHDFNFIQYFSAKSAVSISMLVLKSVIKMIAFRDTKMLTS